MKKFLALSLSDAVFIMLLNVKMPTIVGIFNIYEQDKFSCSAGSQTWFSDPVYTGWSPDLG